MNVPLAQSRFAVKLICRIALRLASNACCLLKSKAYSFVWNKDNFADK